MALTIIALLNGRDLVVIRIFSSARATAIVAAAVALVVIPATAASADTTIDGPIGLGTAGDYSVLAASTVTNTNVSTLSDDLGLSPGSSITGFPPGIVGGTIHQTDAEAAQAQVDLTTAYNVAASLTPIQTGLEELTGLSLVPGVYSGGTLAVSGALVLEGTAESVWVFQAASSLTVGSAANITVTGGASACNVFWQVGSSATLKTGAQFIGTVMADISVTAETAATVTGRLLARTGAVTLDTNTITAPTGCATAPGEVSTSPEITSEAPADGTVGGPYSHTITSSGTPDASYSVTSGQLPAGLVLNEVTGEISGTPTASGSTTFTVTASNGTSPDAEVTYVLVVNPASVEATPETPVDNQPISAEVTPGLAESGLSVGATPFVGAVMIALGVLAVLRSRRLTSRG
nr:ice-binding family protein [Microbacterium halimionae]